MISDFYTHRGEYGNSDSTKNLVMENITGE